MKLFLDNDLIHMDIIVKQMVINNHHKNAQSTMQRGKCLKECKRKQKLELIEKLNPKWIDWFDDLVA